MLKILLTAAAMTAALTLSARAAEMAKCDEATMMKVNDAIKTDTDPKMAKGVEMAKTEMMMATDAMHAKKMNDCSMHIGKAMEEMMMKK